MMSSKNQEKIKTFLHQVSADNPQDKPFDLRHRYWAERKSHQMSFNDLSDWENNNKLQSSSLPQIQGQRQDITDRMKKLDFTTYRSSLLNANATGDDKNNFIAPIVVRFNPRIFTNSLRRSLLSFDKTRKGEEALYTSRPQRKSQVRKIGIDRVKQTYRELSPMGQTQITQFSPKQKERYTGVLRILKRKEKARIKRGNQPVSIDLKAVRLF